MRYTRSWAGAEIASFKKMAFQPGEHCQIILATVGGDEQAGLGQDGGRHVQNVQRTSQGTRAMLPRKIQGQPEQRRPVGFQAAQSGTGNVGGQMIVEIILNKFLSYIIFIF